jgi:hypothetical protein
MLKTKPIRVNFLRCIVKDKSSWGLILSNIIVIITALTEKWDLPTVMIIYWIQSIIIGVFNVAKMLSLKMPFKERGVPQKEAMIGKIFMAGFFTVHYGFFHFGYYEFLRGSFSKIDFNLLVITSAVFFINHLFSFIYNYKEDNKIQDITKLMVLPYQRIVPMHITIIFGFFIMSVIGGQMGAQIALLLFLILKSIADVKMHFMEHLEGKRDQGSFYTTITV